MSYKMSHANALCRKHDSADTLMRFAIRAIRRHRASVNASKITSKEKSDVFDESPRPEDIVLPNTAYIIRQLKRPDEVLLLRKVYGRQFILISAYGPLEARRQLVEKQLKLSLPLKFADHQISALAGELIERDQNENTDHHGQHLRDTFPLADVFIHGIEKKSMSEMTDRFVDSFFGRTDIAPTRTEYGMYAAKSASLRSSDLSRQVGAAIFSAEGEIISQGCNEVPKAFGGTYWDGELPDHRDVKLGHDPNEILKKEIVRDFLERLLQGGMLSETATNIGSSAEIVDALIKTPKSSDAPTGYGSLSDSSIMELTEYGRVVHAEMCAICDAARIGRPVKGATLYCTTFPCHNCTKHLLAAGIRRVIYMEPYPKSKAKELHQNEIVIEEESAACVSFMPFLGISPLRYRDIFEKGKRKKEGVAIQWLGGKPRPMIDISAPAYIDLEKFELSKIIGDVRPAGHQTSPA